eukprot:227302_1
MTLSNSSEMELKERPSDGISKVRFASRSNKLLVASWDKAVRLYDVDTNTLCQKFDDIGAVLDCSFSPDDTQAFSGGLGCELKQINLETAQETVIGSHRAAVSKVEYNPTANLCISGSWDSTVCAWDPRSPMRPACVQQLSGKVYAMAISDKRLVVATGDRKLFIYDLRQMSEPEQTRTSSLKQQTACLQTHTDGNGYVMGSVEGRVAVEFFDLAKEVQDRKYAFKCHRNTDSATGIQTVYPVKSIAFHPVFGTFATAGLDGVVNVWDGDNKKRICQFSPYRMGLTSIDFNHDGSLLAVAVSYAWEHGEKEHDPDTVIVRNVKKHEVQPKTKRQ